jgi:hypothetical protein
VFHSACFAEACSGSTRARGVDPPANRQGPVARPTYNADPPLSDLTMLACVLQAAKTPSRNGGPFYGPNRGGPTFSNSRSKIKLRRNRVKNTPQGFTLLLKTRLIVNTRLTCELCAASFPARVRLQSGVVCRNLGAALVLCVHRSLHPGWQQQPQVPCVCVAVREAAALGSGLSAVLRLPARLGAACVLCRCLAGVVLTVGSNQGVVRRGPLAWRRGYH